MIAVRAQIDIELLRTGEKLDGYPGDGNEFELTVQEFCETHGYTFGWNWHDGDCFAYLVHHVGPYVDRFDSKIDGYGPLGESAAEAALHVLRTLPAKELVAA